MAAGIHVSTVGDAAILSMLIKAIAIVGVALVWEVRPITMVSWAAICVEETLAKY
jgi:hypothetical protein